MFLRCFSIVLFWWPFTFRNT